MGGWQHVQGDNNWFITASSLGLVAQRQVVLVTPINLEVCYGSVSLCLSFWLKLATQQGAKKSTYCRSCKLALCLCFVIVISQHVVDTR